MAFDALARLFSVILSLEGRELETDADEDAESVRGVILPEHGTAGNAFSIFLSILPFGVSGISGTHTHFEGIA